MLAEIHFEYVRSATSNGSEDAYLVYLDKVLTALLVPAETGWFLQFGLGSCEREGLIFTTLAAAENWVRLCVCASV
ncbi:hypothetical protein FV226_15850 [Methylobacterium sp. WL12]|nr:hypothetical protein FV226_15850 [Methylobacterium sp. WL12]